MYGNSIQIPCISKTWITAFLQFRTLLAAFASSPKKSSRPKTIKVYLFRQRNPGKPTHATGTPIPNLSETTTTSCYKTKFIDGMKKENQERTNLLERFCMWVEYRSLGIQVLQKLNSKHLFFTFLSILCLFKKLIL